MEAEVFKLNYIHYYLHTAVGFEYYFLFRNGQRSWMLMLLQQGKECHCMVFHLASRIMSVLLAMIAQLGSLNLSTNLLSKMLAWFLHSEASVQYHSAEQTSPKLY